MVWHALQGSLDVGTLLRALTARQLSAKDVVSAVLERLTACGDESIWITRVDGGALYARAEWLDHYASAHAEVFDELPLFGIPFAVKDNIDVAGLPTTAACPEFAYVPERTAFVVQRLLSAGAILVGKTNMDQFATGLVGTRSPYGVPVNPFDRRYVPGGSSSGSAMAVSRGLVAFALGTDTAGSGRVPAAFGNIVGLKPTRGVLSNTGTVPACRSLDCISVFALNCQDAVAVTNVMAAYDENDAFARRRVQNFHIGAAALPPRFHYAVPRPGQLLFFGDVAAQSQFDKARARLDQLGGAAKEIDFAPFLEAAAMLYNGPWVAERLAAAGALLQDRPQVINPDVRRAIESGRHYRAVDAFTAYYRLRELKRDVKSQLDDVLCLAVPTFGRPVTLDEVKAKPAEMNAQLGYYTNFVNLLDLAAISIPAGFLASGMPFGVMLIGPALSESRLCALGARLHLAAGVMMGASPHPVPAWTAEKADIDEKQYISVSVSGAHMSGLALNKQLITAGARFLRTAKTAPHYRLYNLEHMVPPRPGMIRTGEAGFAIDVEVWAVPATEFGRFVAGIPTPLGIGKVELAGGEWVCGFLCEPYAIERAKDISELGGWRQFLAASPK